MSEDPYNNPYNKVVNTVRGALWNGPASRAADEVRERYIVIDRVDLPEVTREGSRYDVDGETYTWDFTGPPRLAPEYSGQTTAERMRSLAKKALAVALFAEANPPADEKQVRALTVALYEEAGATDWAEADDMARQLYKRGVRVEVSKP